MRSQAVQSCLRELLQLVRDGIVAPSVVEPLLRAISDRALGADSVRGDIAVIGLAGSFPGAADIPSYWKMLRDGRDGVAEIPVSRWDWRKVFSERPCEKKSYSKWAGLLAGIELFDPSFFNISNREALAMDPQQRWFLKAAWHALEDGGYAEAGTERNRCGVFAGCKQGDYRNLLGQSAQDIYGAIGCDTSILSARISYLLDLAGPAITVDTACSSSLTAVALACDSLCAGVCDIAVAGGVSALCTPELHISLSQSGMLSPTGRCRTFDEAADGFVPAEAVGAVLLKPLKKAREDGDHIYAVIEAWGLNQDGRTNGITAPNGVAQAALLRDTYRRFGIRPETIGYIETHGTGTQLGDPIELQGLASAFREFTEKRQFCAIGSVKTNIGHALASAGIAGLIKAIGCMEYGELFPSIHYRNPNPMFDLSATPFRVVTEKERWETNGNPRRAAVSSFGFSGTNAHVVIREGDPAATEQAEKGSWVFPLSARTPAALEALKARMAEWVELERPTLRGLSFSLMRGRGFHESREVLQAASHEELRRALGGSARAEAETRLPGEARRWLLGERNALAEMNAALRRNGARRIAVPGYVFQELGFWPITTTSEQARSLRAAPDGAFRLSRRDPILRDHVIEGRATAPAVFSLCLALKESGSVLPIAAQRLREVTWTRPAVAHAADLELRLRWKETQAGDQSFVVESSEGVHVEGIAQAGSVGPAPSGVDIRGLKRRLTGPVFADEVYASFRRRGFEYGDALQGIKELWRSETEALALLRRPALTEGAGAELALSVGMLDGALQALLGLKVKGADWPPVPFSLGALTLYKPIGDECYAWLRLTGKGTDWLRFDIDLLNMDGSGLLRMERLTVRPLRGDRKPVEEDRLELRLRRALARETGLAESDIAIDENFARFGIDSMMALSITRELEETFGELPKTLFFEFNTIASLAAHLREGFPNTAQAASSDTVVSSPQALEATPVEHGVESIGDEFDQGAEPIAIVGMAGRFPGAANLDQFWENLRAGRDSITEIPGDRWDHSRYYDARRGQPGKTCSRWGGFLDGMDLFDPLLFRISPREAEVMDPQERLFLETAWETAENAGYAPRELAGRAIGVYAGAMYTQYQLFGAEAGVAGEPMALNSSQAAIANRVSYCLDLRGPSIGLDTMCSSALTAIHMACSALRSGEIEAAFAGGVNLTLHPQKYLLLSQANVASSDGRCRSFGAGGDGYVPGEGVGVVLLKTLRRALADGDTVQGVIRGSAVNHGGLANGFTVPSVPAQAEVMRECLKRSGVDPLRVSYIEAHGTGTSLGDPIEVAALEQVYGGNGSRDTPCAIGSVKSNIGHLESAAGMAGIAKVLLQMRHGELAPTLHAETINPNLKFAPGVFHLQREMGAWPAQENGLPRTAGISSFGAGGANAHVLIEEYCGQPLAETHAPQVLPLSARTPELLRDLCARMARFAEAGADGFRLEDVAFTLQCGRQVWSERMAVVAKTVEEWASGMRSWLAGNMPRAKRDLVELANRWIDGEAVDFASARAGFYHRRVPLPASGFLRERCWAPKTWAAKAEAGNPGEQSTRNAVAVESGWLDDHVVHGHGVLPAAAALSLFQTAAGAPSGFALREVRWLRPAVFNGTRGGLEIERSGDRWSLTKDNLEVAAAEHGPGLADVALGSGPYVDLQAVRARLKQSRDVGGHYRECERSGLEYGPSFRVLEELRPGTGEVFAALRFRGHGNGGPSSLEPALIDGGLQAVAAMEGRWNAGAPPLPASLRRLFTYRALPADPLVYARVAGDDAQAFDVDYCTRQGEVCVRLEGLRVEQPRRDSRQSQPLGNGAGNSAEGIFYFEPRWVAKDGEPGRRKDVIVCDGSGNLIGNAALAGGVALRVTAPESLEAARRLVSSWKTGKLAGSTVVFLVPDDGSGVHGLLRLVRALLEQRPTQRREILYFHSAGRGGAEPANAAVAALARTLEQESPKLTCRVVEYPAGSLANVLECELLVAGGGEVAYRNGQRLVRAMAACEARRDTDLRSANGKTISLRRGGVYLITGGRRGIGLGVAEYLARNYAAKLILVGRSERERDFAAIEQLRELGAEVLSLRADIALAGGASEVIRLGMKRFGRIDGVIHSAGILRDGFLLSKTEADFDAVAAPKVEGARNLFAALEGQEPEFVALFSSLAAVAGNSGQSDYAYANAFLDHWAEKWTGRAHVVSINWPYWREGGMQLSERALEQMRLNTGLRALETADGIKALEYAIGCGARNVVVASGDGEKLHRFFDAPVRTLEASHVGVASVARKTGHVVMRSNGMRSDKFIGAKVKIAATIGQVLKLAPERIRADQPLTDFGMDSVSAMEIAGALEDEFGPQPDTLLFEYPTLDGVVAHLAAGELESLEAREGTPAAAPEPGPNNIAIVGLAGRYPFAESLEELWSFLADGRDGVTEIPKERWNASDWQSDGKQTNGTSACRWGSFLSGWDRFDPRFFGITRREAALMDPHERIFLEVAWHALEDAALTRRALAGQAVGVFAGAMWSQYQLYGDEALRQGQPLPASSFSSIANRLSYFGDFNGPSLAVDTMCSSSLTAIHLAVQSLLRDECHTAIAGGVNLTLHPHKYVLLSQGKFVSTTGRCRSFGPDADGYVPGEGAGVVVLKRLTAALADGDPVRAVIKATAMNHGGRSGGYSVPNPHLQARLLEEAWRAAGGAPVSYVEAHGTGTALGDPLEVAGIREAMRASCTSGECRIGSIKSNLGHLEAAAGVAGLTKVILQLEKGQLVPSLHADPCSTRLDFGGLPLSVQTKLEEWPRSGGALLRAGVSSFGAGGTNAHVVVEEFVARETHHALEVPRVVALSARTSESLKSSAAALADFVEPGQFALNDVCWTLQLGREAWEERAAFVAGGREELLAGLRKLASGGTLANGYRGRTSNSGAPLSASNQASSLDETARAWTEGVEVEWRKLWTGAAGRRIKLPGYRFAKERHWFTAEPKPDTSAAVTSNVQPKRNRERVHALLATVAGLAAEEIEPDANFADMGIDSVLQREMIADLEREFGKLPATLLWEFPTATTLTTYLDGCPSIGDDLSARVIEPPAKIALANKLQTATRGLREEVGRDEPIAIVGVHGRYPGAENLDLFWERLRTGQSMIGTVPKGRWRHGSYEDLTCQVGAFLSGVDCFDPYLFGITPAEAAQMNPEERLLLESAWACLEDAGYARTSWAGRRIGVYVGATTNTYPMVAADMAGTLSAASPDASTYSLANRISYTMDWTGPSLTVDTACSSALMAIHMACESIRRGESEGALAAAVNLYLHPSKYSRMAQGNLLAREASQGLFDASANGFVPGEGVGSVLLRPLAAALRDGDVIHGVIRATAVRHKGRSNGFLTPRSGAQQQVIEETLEDAGLDASGVGFLELQATGSAGTDGMEFEALRAVFPRAILGSLKPVIGHLEGASGMAALAKLLLQLRHREIPGVAVAEKTHTEIRLNETALRVPTQTESWSGEFPRRGGIGSFGVGGVNAFMVVEEPPARVLTTEDHGAQTVVLSAKTLERLNRLEAGFSDFLERYPETRLDQLAWTLQTGREHFAVRSGVVVRDTTELREALREGRIERGRAGTASAGQAEPVDGFPAAALRLWLDGGRPDWARLHGGIVPMRISLPHYPFERVRCWIDMQADAEDMAAATSAVATYYDTVAVIPNGEMPMLTFAPFPAKLQGFQWLRAMAGVESNAEFRNVTRQRQLELRQLAFCHVDWARVERVLDIGCGLSADLLRIAEEHPHVQLDGFTISALQAEQCRRAVDSKKLAERCRIYKADSAADAFPHKYDLIYGFEVSFHIEKKTALFENIAKHLAPGGKVVLIDTVATTVTPLNAPHLGQFTSNESEWARMLATQGLRLNAAIDASAEVANFLDDPDFEAHLAELSAASAVFKKTEAEHRGWHQFGKMLAEGLTRYMILEMEADAAMPVAALEEWNLRTIRAPKAYGAAEAEDRAKEHPDAVGHFSGDEHLESVTAIASDLLGIPLDRLDVEQPFGEYGVTSLIGLRLLERINRQLDARLEMPLLYSAPTLRLMARQLALQVSARQSATVVARTSVAAGTVSVAAPIEGPSREQIAVIGMAGRFPGARNVEEFWRNLAAGRDAVTEIPPERWDWRPHFDADPSRLGRTYCRWGGFLDGADEFDAAFFRIAPAEAEVTDPQQRMFLETCWHALDDAGYGGERANGLRCGVMVGALESDFGQRLRADANPTCVAQGMLGNAPSILAARIAYFLNLRGPAVSINTACSSSLVGVHLACQSLRNGETDLMLAGGVSFYPDEGPFILMSKAGMLSPSGRCRTFDAGADGIVVGEAVAAVVLKRLSDAVRDGDVIYGVIAGSGMNQDGTTNGLTAPNGDAQRDLALDVLERSGLNASEVSFIECHGTGTRLGDPVEVRAIAQAYGKEVDGERNRCALGSVKSSVGHTSAAAGIVGVIKVLLGLRHGQIPATLHMEKLNPLLGLVGSRFHVNTELSEWMPNGLRRVAALNSFGYSGTNATVLLTEYLVNEEGGLPEETGPSLIPLSAKDSDGLERLKKELAAWLVEDGDGNDSRVTEILAETLALPAGTLTEGTQLDELGWDAHQISLTARRLEQALDVKITPASLAEAGSVGELARRLRPRRYRGDLAAIAAALQCDRAVLPNRVAYVASSTENLYKQLLEEVRSGRTGDSKESSIEEMFALRDWAGMATAWEAGRNIDWRELWINGGDGLPRKRARLLPPYPFARRAYPLPPRLVANTDEEAAQRATNQMRMDDDLLRDHRILGEAVLPGAATLCAAMAAARRRSPQASIEDFIWRTPHREAVIDAKVEGELILLSAPSGGVIAQCRVKINAARDWTRDSYPLPTLRESATRRLDKATFYALFAEHGLAYGDSMQVVEELHVCDGGLLARIALPSGYETEARFLDGAFQAVLAAFGEQDQCANLPFSLGAAEWNQLRRESGYAWVEKRMNEEHTFDIVLLANDGATIGSLRGLCLRALEQSKQLELRKSELVFASLQWESRTAGTGDVGAPEVWLLRGFAPDECAAIRAAAPVGVDVVERGSSDAPDRRQPRRVLLNVSGNGETGLTELLSTALELRSATNVKLLALANHSSKDAPPPIHAAIRSLALEFPAWICGVLQIEKHQVGWPAIVAGELMAGQDAMVRFVNGKREVLIMRPATAGAMNETLRGIPWNQKTWLVTGATGALGQLTARHLASRGPVNLVLTGRRQLDARIVEELRAADAEVFFQSADLSDAGQVAELVSNARSRFGSIHGWIHAAGESQARRVDDKNAAQVASVLAAKVTGVRLLDEALRRDPLDRIVLFSSIAAVFGDFGQADYAFANASLDQFAEERRPVAVSIRWPILAGGGMQIPEATRRFLAESYGVEPLPDELFRSVLDLAIEGRDCQLMPLYGNREKLRNLLSPKQFPSPAPAAMVDGRDNKVEEILCAAVAAITHIDLRQIDSNADLREFGLDSIGYTELANELNRKLGARATPALFFEAKNLKAVARAVIASLPSLLPNDLPSSPQTIPDSLGIMGTLAMETDKAPLPALRSLPEDAIAVIGMSGRYPGAENLEEYWQQLINGEDLITEVPAERWSRAQSENAVPHQGGFLRDVAKFDAEFFGISPREAALMDPQQRLFLETVWTTIENAGYRPSSLAGTSTGVFVGVANMDYANLMARSGVPVEAHATTGVSHAILANRVSFLLDLRGPSEPIDTACSSSLVSVHRAIEAIRSGSCEQAIAGGVNVLLSSDLFVSFAQAGMLSPTGRCRTFDASADGYVRGEGVGAVFLKPLKRALQEGDQVLAVIRGSGESHNGRANGLTAPNGEGQAALLTRTYERAGIDPASIGYVEAHGTATPIGDPVECNALREAFNKLRAGRGEPELPAASCGLGSVKSNIGHLETAAGIAGLHKVILALRNRRIPPTLHVSDVNPYLQLDKGPFYLVTNAVDWPSDADGPRRAGISSFGFGGANAHLIVEEAPEAAKPEAVVRTHLFVLSARSEERLRAAAGLLEAHVERRISDEDLERLAFTLQTGRETRTHRLAILAATPQELCRQLKGVASGDAPAKTVFLGSAKSGTIAMDDGEGREFARALWNKDRLDQLARLWVSGANLDWEFFYDARRPVRIDAPAYPFERTRHWFTSQAEAAVPESAPHSKIAPTAAPKIQLRRTAETPAEVKPQLEHGWALVPIAHGPSNGHSGANGNSGTNGHAGKNGHSTNNSHLPTSGETNGFAAANGDGHTHEHLSTSGHSAPNGKPATNGHSAMANSGQAAHETEVRAAIRKQLAKVLFLKEEAIDEDRPFVELGLDSILAVELVRFLNRTYRIELKTSRLFDCPTVAALGKRVSELSSRRDEPMAQDAVSESHRDNPQPATSTAPAPVTGQHRIRELIAARLSEVRQ